MMSLCCDVLEALRGRTLVTAESITGGGIGAALTAVSGSSAVYKGGVISYCDDVKQRILGVEAQLLERVGAVSAPVARAMAEGARQRLGADVAVSVTGLAGPGGDAYGNPLGTLFIGYADDRGTKVREYRFTGTREEIRRRAIISALEFICDENR